MSSTSVGLVLAVVTALGPPAENEALGPEGRALLEEGSAAYARRDFEAAADAFRRGYETDGASVFLYTWAQAARYADDCALAVELYDRYLATEPSASQRAAALEYRAKCASMASAPPSPRDVTPAPEPAAAPIGRDEPPPAISATRGRPAPSRSRRTTTALVAVGSIATAIGFALAGVGLAATVQQRNARVYGPFRDLERRERGFLGAGVPIVTVGLAVLVVGLIRATRGRPEPRAATLRGGDDAPRWVTSGRYR